MKKITSKLVAVLMIVVMAFGISGTATVKTEAKESKKIPAMTHIYN